MSSRGEDRSDVGPERLLDLGRESLAQCDVKAAEGYFRKAVESCTAPQARTNLALCLFLSGDYSGALEVLEPLDRAEYLSPFGRAVECRARVALGDTVGAHRALRRGLLEFEYGLGRLSPLDRQAQADWTECVQSLKIAAGELGEHKTVLELHKKWPRPYEDASCYYAGAASYNLKRYGQAARLWASMQKAGWAHLAEPLAKVAELTDRGIVPHFVVPYDTFGAAFREAPTPESITKHVSTPFGKLQMLQSIFCSEDTSNSSLLLASLILSTGDWGKQLADNILQGSVDFSYKFSAARALVEMGIYAENQPIPVLVDGRPTLIKWTKNEVLDHDADLDRVVQQAIHLRNSGDVDGAYCLLNDLVVGGKAYPPAIMTLANLMRSRKEYSQARSLLESLEDIFPNNPRVQFNLCGLALQEGLITLAWKHFDKIDTTNEDTEFKNKCKWLKEQLDIFAPPDAVSFEDENRLQKEEEPISLEIPLSSALRKMPVQWLDFASTVYKTAGVRLRKDRQQLVAAAIMDSERLAEVLEGERQEVKYALAYLLDNSGYAKLQTMTRRFGTMEKDGFFWDKKPPVSPLGRLCGLGLVHIGRGILGGRRHKVVVIPKDIRGVLATALGYSGE